VNGQAGLAASPHLSAFRYDLKDLPGKLKKSPLYLASFLSSPRLLVGVQRRATSSAALGSLVKSRPLLYGSDSWLSSVPR